MAIFQHHLFSRTRDFADDFAKSLSKFDEVILLDIYPAREKPINGVSTELITNELKKMGHSNVIYQPNKDKIPITVKEIHEKGDLIITMGAGDIWRQIEKIYEEISI